jgi:hypothetical protein
LEVVVDKAAIFAEVTKRNALRRANLLPPIDVRAEYKHEVSIAQQREFDAYCEQHADERDIIQQQVFNEFRAEHGAATTLTMADQWRLRVLGRKRFEEIMAQRFGIARPPSVAGRNPIIYGGDRKDEA